MGVFGKNSTPPLSPKRNTFDMSHQNNLTMRFGELYPFHVEPVIPGDTAKIDVAFGLRAMPTAFPTQTKVRVDAHYFYVRLRNLWKDWPNFIGKTGNPSPLPYMSSEQLYKLFATGSLGDYMGLPTNLVDTISPQLFGSQDVVGLYYPSEGMPIRLFAGSDETSEAVTPDVATFTGNRISFTALPLIPANIDGVTLPAGSRISVTLHLSKDAYGVLFSDGNPRVGTCIGSPDTTANNLVSYTPCENITFGSITIGKSEDGSDDYIVPLSFNIADVLYTTDDSSAGGTSLPGYSCILIGYPQRGRDASFGISPFLGAVYTEQRFDYLSDISTQLVDDFNSEHSISALPFRAYESIYNAFYRDQRNNPYIVNGVQDPNVYLPTTDGGEDNNVYELRRRNWEQDFITSAVPSPQQGAAPLVGITSSGVASFASDDGTIHKVQLETEDGDHVTGVRYSTNLPDDVSRSLVNIASSGFSIADFRGVNALQRWLEINMRRGLKYRDQIKSHFGVTPSFAELDMPEFIGGFTKWFDSSQVNQTSATDPAGDPLGSYAGQLSAVGGTEHTINHYCDEHGYIIGIVSIVPVPVYSQLLPKDFLKRDPLDYFFPEFGHLGFQPITYAEVCPFQKLLVDGGGLTSTFGYQRAWYDYLARTDEAHGNFRNTLRDFLLARQFKNVPSLNADFLTVDPSQLNGIFTINEIDGEPVMPFLGQIHIKNIMKRPIPKYGIPRLE